MDEKAKVDLSTLEEKHTAETTKIKGNIEEVGNAQTEAQKKLDVLTASMNEQLRVLAATRPALFQAGVDTKTLADAQGAVAPASAAASTAMTQAGASAKVLAGDLAGTNAELQKVKANADAARASLDALTASLNAASAAAS